MSSSIKQKIKLLFISIDKFPPFRVDISVLFGKELHSRGHQIDYLLQSEDDYHKFDKTKWMGATAYIGPTDNGTHITRRFFKHFLSIINDLRMIRLVKREKYDFIQVRDKFVAAIFGLVLSKMTGCKFLFWISYPFPEADLYEYRTGTAPYPKLYYIRGTIIKFLMYKIILPFADHIFAQSEQMKSDFCSLGISADKITAVPMGVDLDDAIEPSVKDDTIDENAPIVIYIGVMQKVRRIDFLLRVFKQVLKQVPNAKLYMVGGSPEPGDMVYLKKEAERLGIENSTKFTGMVPRLQALQYVQNATVCVSPIYPNPIYIPSSPTKTVEYMLMKKPVVVNDIPEQLRIVKESGAGYCVKWDEQAFADAIIKIIENPEAAVDMGKKGYAFVRQYRNYRVLSDIVEKQYIKLVDGR